MIRVCLKAALLLSAIAGCSESPVSEIPDHLRFASRKDRLVIQVPDREPPPPSIQRGQLDEELASLDQLGGRTIDPQTLPSAAQQRLAIALSELFGEPASPSIPSDAETAPLAERLGLLPDQLIHGGRLYYRHCLQCHGLSGDGRGPTGLWIHPYPRDFRRGSFKFTSTGDFAKPSKTDLLNTITNGLPGTAMPSFALLPLESRERLASYVIYLSIRGQVEFLSLQAIANDEIAEDEVPIFARERLRHILRSWDQANPRETASPSGSPEREEQNHHDSIRRGFELFTSSQGPGCISCHHDFGRHSIYRYDVWGTVVRPADLTRGLYKSGKDDVEIFRRIRGGIAASGMPAHPGLSDCQVWDLVRFVKSLPYPRELPPDIREKVYRNHD